MTIEILNQFADSPNMEGTHKVFNRLNQQIIPKHTNGTPAKKPSQFELGINMTSDDKMAYKMMVTGCQGEGTPAQRNVANAMNQKLKTYAPDKISGLLLGDNFYDSGVDTTDDPKFKDLFTNMYSQSFNWFAALGNHDWNFQNSIKTWMGKTAPHQQKAMAQVEHTYSSLDKKNKVDMWLMPHRYYVIETNWANIIVLDSNTLYFDPQQQDWFKNILKRANEKTPHRKNVIAMHHPLLSAGKRNPFSDAKDVHQYILPEYKYTGPRDTSLNNLLLTLFKEIQSELRDAFKIDLILCAHDHFLADSYLYELSCKQLTIGGGGGPLQDIKIEKTCQFQAKTHGFVELDFNKENINYTFFDSNPRTLYSDSSSTTPYGQRPRAQSCSRPAS